MQRKRSRHEDEDAVVSEVSSENQNPYVPTAEDDDEEEEEGKHEDEGDDEGYEDADDNDDEQSIDGMQKQINSKSFIMFSFSSKRK